MTKAKSSRITRTKTTAPRAARKRKNVLAEEAVIEIAAPLPEVVVEAAPPPIVEAPPPIVDSTPVPWTPPPSRERPRVPWIGLDGRQLVRAVARRVARELERRIPLLGRVGGWLRAL